MTIVTLSPGHATWGVSLLLMGCALLVVVGVLFDQKNRVLLRSGTNSSRESSTETASERV